MHPECPPEWGARKIFTAGPTLTTDTHTLSTHTYRHIQCEQSGAVAEVQGPSELVVAQQHTAGTARIGCRVASGAKPPTDVTYVSAKACMFMQSAKSN